VSLTRTDKPTKATVRGSTQPDIPDSVALGLTRRVYYLEASALLILTGVLIVVFSLLPATRDTFPTLANLQATVANEPVLAAVALAALITLI
jgi:hypothetical protein